MRRIFSQSKLSDFSTQAFVSSASDSTAITNSYYITAFGNTLQGAQVYSISKGQYVTTLENAGTVSNNYTTSGLTFYNVGLQYGNMLYAPANNYVSLTLDHVNRENEGEGSGCSKFIFNPDTPKLFIPKGDKDYALAYTDGAKVMPLNFTYTKQGIYTLTFDTEAIECDYMHLIDNATGIDIDLFQTPSYTFNSSDCNYATRFKIVFEEQAANDIVDNFAYVSNGELIINGTGTLQVFDILGR